MQETLAGRAAGVREAEWGLNRAIVGPGPPDLALLSKLYELTIAVPSSRVPSTWPTNQRGAHQTFPS